ncbi:MAG TPA: response regulator transcription factor [Burkholderiales bacterium]|jgi:DNA-binding NarL/FixJ family response regulator|nr:response regulator transcription factor [Burkholderiales bacterium]
MNIRVLIADDHGVVAEGLRSLIEAQRDMLVVALASNGQDAVRCSLETNPDVVVMDNAMPVLNGTEAARLIRKRRAQIRVVMLSMHSDSVHVRRAFEAGASGYVLKNSVGNELIDAIRAVHAGRRFLGNPLAEGLIDRIASDVPADLLSRLNARDRQVLQAITEGKSSAEAGAILHLSPRTVETYRRRLMQKLQITDLPTLVKFAIRHGITAVE